MSLIEILFYDLKVKLKIKVRNPSLKTDGKSSILQYHQTFTIRLKTMAILSNLANVDYSAWNQNSFCSEFKDFKKVNLVKEY